LRLQIVKDSAIPFFSFITFLFFPFFPFFPFFLSTMSVDFKPTILSALDTMRLGELAAEGGKFKALAYKKAIDSIRRFEGTVTSAEQLKGVDGVGKKIYDKIVEILATGRLASAERMKERSDVGAMEALLGVHGIGPVKAKDLIKAGITTIALLRAEVAKDPSVLNDTQKLGLKYYEAGLERIPRAEMIQHETLLKSLLPPTLSGTIVGSYRRGAANSGDIDMLVSYDPSVSEKDAGKAFKTLVSGLGGAYTVEKLAGGAKKWMGYIHTAGATPRRLDLLLTPPDEYPYAILYFTGSDKFNVAMRKYALTLGYSLSEHGIKVIKAKEVPLLRKEEDIFAFLGLRYIPPTERVDAQQIVLRGDTSPL